MGDIDLELRIGRAFKEQPQSDVVVALIAETRSAAQVADEEAVAARAAALDPTLSQADVADARSKMEDALFKRERANAAISRLNERLKELRHLEDQARRRRAYDEAREERDKLAQELADLYPGFAPKLAEVLTRIVANDRVLKIINTQLPEGGVGRLPSAEAVARGLGDTVFVEHGVAIPRLTEGVRLPPWGKSQKFLYDSC
jgi:hypothetical protein